jgi:hypothetical protein
MRKLTEAGKSFAPPALSSRRSQDADLLPDGIRGLHPLLVTATQRDGSVEVSKVEVF